jgi:hypothetical protein
MSNEPETSSAMRLYSARGCLFRDETRAFFASLGLSSFMRGRPVRSAPTIGELPLERGDGALKIYPPRRIRSGKDWIGRVGGVRQPRVLFLGGNADRENPDKTIEIADKTADLFDFP